MQQLYTVIKSNQNNYSITLFMLLLGNQSVNLPKIQFLQLYQYVTYFCKNMIILFPDFSQQRLAFYKIYFFITVLNSFLK